MGIFDSLTNMAFGKPSDEDEDKLDRLMKRGLGLYSAHQMADQAIDSLWETEEENLARQRSKLEIGMMRRNLGMMDDDDYEAFLNDEKRRDYVGPGLLGGAAAFLNRHFPKGSIFTPPRPPTKVLGEGIPYIVGGGPRYGGSGKLGRAASLFLRR